MRIPLVRCLVLGDGDDHLVGQLCESCSAVYLDRRNACGRCGGRTFRERRLATTGVVRTFTIVYRSAPGVATPFVSAIVDLDGGPSVRANLLHVAPEPEAIPPAMPVRLSTFVAGTDPAGDECVAFGFTPV